MDLSSLPDLTPYVTDIILIFISGSACLYCAALSRRLKKLNNLKTGVGASIVSLTHAIEDTHKANQKAKRQKLKLYLQILAARLRPVKPHNTYYKIAWMQR